MATKARTTAARKKKDLVGPGTQAPTTAAAAQEAKAGLGSVDTRKVKVIATRMGYYQHKRRREGDVFHLVPLRTVKRATQEDCDKDSKLTIGMVLKDPRTRQPIPVIKTAMEQFSEKWMEIVDTDVPTRITGLKEGMRKEHDDILLDKYPHLAGQGDDEDEDVDNADSGEGIDDSIVTGDTEVL